MQHLLDYLKTLTPVKAALHMVTALVLALSFKLATGDLDIVFDRIIPENPYLLSKRQLREFQGLKQSVDADFTQALVNMGGRHMALMVYHDYYYPGTGFTAIRQTAAFIVSFPTVDRQEEERILKNVQGLPVLRDASTETLLKGECYVEYPLREGYYFRNIALVLDIGKLYMYPLSNYEGELVGYLIASFDSPIPFESDEHQRVCSILETAAAELKTTREYVEIFEL